MHDFGTVSHGRHAGGLQLRRVQSDGHAGFHREHGFRQRDRRRRYVGADDERRGSAGSLSLAAGMGHTFTAMLSTAAVGSFSATYTLNFSDENLAGAQNKSITLTLLGNVILAGDYNRDGIVDAADYTVWRRFENQSVTAYSGADGDGDGLVDDDDFDLWKAHFGDVAAGSGVWRFRHGARTGERAARCDCRLWPPQVASDRVAPVAATGAAQPHRSQRCFAAVALVEDTGLPDGDSLGLESTLKLANRFAAGPREQRFERFDVDAFGNELHRAVAEGGVPAAGTQVA